MKKSLLNHYVLDTKGRVVVEKNVIKWAVWFENINNRLIKVTLIGKKYRVSSVFLGMDHNFSERGRPILWETMVFSQRISKIKNIGGKKVSGLKYHKPFDEYTGRHRSRAETTRYHDETVKKLRKA